MAADHAHAQGDLGDTAEFHRFYNDNMRLSRRLRTAAALVLLLLGVAWAMACVADPGGVPPFGRLALAGAASVPFLLLWWMLQRWSFEARTLAYGFQRKAIVEERLFRYAGTDEGFRRELLKIYLVHWMEKSPLEVMLALDGKGKGMGGASPTAALVGKAGRDAGEA